MFCGAPPLPPPLLSSSSRLHGRSPPFIDATTIIKAVIAGTVKRDVFIVSPLHALSIKSGLFGSKLLVANAFLDAYPKCAQIEVAEKVFDKMPERDIASWTSLISSYIQNGSAEDALSVFVELISDGLAVSPEEFTASSISKACVLLKDGRLGKAMHGFCLKRRFFENVYVCTSIIAMYSKLGILKSAVKLLYDFEDRCVAYWSSVVSGCVLQGMFRDAMRIFTEMLEDGVFPNFVTMLSVIQACSMMRKPRFFGWVHAWISKLALENHDSVMNSLVKMYCNNGLLDEGVRVLVQLWFTKGRDSLYPETMAAVIRGSTLSKSLPFGRGFHGFLVKQGLFPCTFIENLLINMYGKLEQVDSANLVFRLMKRKDIVSWNSLISCFLKNKSFVNALEVLSELHRSSTYEVVPDAITMMTSIQACAELTSLLRGEILHGYAVKSGIDSEALVSNALICLYAKSERIEFSEKVFYQMNLNDISTWNTMILVLGTNGNGMAALSIFEELKKRCVLKPDAITFVNVITACSHSGLVAEGYECFKSIQRDYGIEPDMRHYASVVCLFGRSGKLDAAENFIREMPIQPGSDIWGSLLDACVVYGDVGVAERAVEALSVLDPDGKAWRVSLSNVYAVAGRWEDAARISEKLKTYEGSKEAGWSSVEVNCESYKFIVGDTRHPEAKKI